MLQKSLKELKLIHVFGQTTCVNGTHEIFK